MGEDKPGWYYVGPGHLRYMDADGWTDQYKPLDAAAKSNVEPTTASLDVVGPVASATAAGSLEILT